MTSFFSRLKNGLSRSRDALSQLVPGGSVDALSEEEWLDIEDGLIMADCGGELAGELVHKARKRRGGSVQALKESMISMLPEVEPVNMPAGGPFVLLVVGVNGTGKTTTIGKIATMFRQQGKSVLVGAADTFRAAAVEQLAVWVERAGAEMVRQHEGADPAAVAFDTIQRGVARNYDVVIIDTAGRVQTDRGLMDELAKVRRVITKAYPEAPHEVWQVVDGGTGQNAVMQVDKFREVAGTSGLIVTKLDGSGKGGIVLQLSHRFGLPIRYVGVGETLEDLMEFDGEAFINSLLPDQPE
ncbi:signal recognition particle-docking protein FtsY [Mariprofundus sp. NF]|uniref:signal recognition particle-docking protein FtsY n=1 Tax=Mariprofundus sp. NF TaxID=2608716 RepID=UPI0015A20001|nr:signal recognition particle-docking protein FtsY [Mariprofundus sp. NF]NWF37739.1 signal recognition particle-docking protein FtsY [Mariprofundus sp. NF]